MLALWYPELEGDNVHGSRAVVYIGISIGLTILAGLMSGLTLGLMSMDHVDLEVGLLARHDSEPR